MGIRVNTYASYDIHEKSGKITFKCVIKKQKDNDHANAVARTNLVERTVFLILVIYSMYFYHEFNL